MRALVLLLAAAALPLGAQQADVIRGRVTGEDGKVVEGAVVAATSIPNNVAKTAKTDRGGRFALVFPGGDGDYWLTVTAIGFAPKRFELKRVADEDVLVADTRLAPLAPTVLDAVNVRAERTRVGRNDASSDPTGTEKTVTTTAVDPAQAGNLAAIAATLPGVQLLPGADGNPDQFSVFGLGGEQNAATLNGLGYGGGEIPRDAATRTSLGTSPWDVSRGGFSGGQLGVRTQSGSNFSSRGTSVLLNAPATEWTDRAGRATGAQYSSLSLGAATAGPIAMDRSFYSAGYQFDRRASALQNLPDADPIALRLAGVAPDSAARFQSILGRASVPRTVGGLPSRRLTDRGAFLAALDLAPPSATSGPSLNVTASGTFARATSLTGRVTGLPTDDVGGTNWFASLQARHTTYVGFGMLSETSLGVSQLRNETDPYLEAPSGVVRVASSLDGGSAAIGRLTFGGSQTQRQRTSGTTVGAQNVLSWFSRSDRHRLKLASELRYEDFGQRFTSNQYGTFAYNSLAELEAGTPASFTRLLAPTTRDGRQLVGALSLGDAYRPRTDLQLQYGVRLDANHFLTTPAANPALRSAFGIDNAAVPNRVYASPRIGFSYTYGTAPQLAIGNGFMRGPRAVLRGGVGVFQNVPNVQLVGAAMSSTGLASATQQLVCVGAAVPTPRWNDYVSDAGTIPARCADSSTSSGFASRTPDVGYFARGYRAQRSLRSTLSWTSAILGNRLAASLEAAVSRNLAQPGIVDRNFDPTTRFRLDDEGGRPVYVQPASIVPATGAIAAQDARLDPAFRFVAEQRSDFSSTSRQLTASLAPATFRSRFGWSLSYVYASTRDVASGFASTAGDPRVRDRAPASLDSRHQIVYGLSYDVLGWVPVSLNGSFRSGRPYTPLVAADVNGDGFANDRAYVFAPSTTTDPALASAMRDLLGGGSRSARACLTRQIGTLAARNGCRAPWSSTSSLTVALDPVKFRLPQRMTIALYVNNALGAADLLLHGEDGRRGWGRSVVPDATLLYVRGFDAATRRFRYEVNPRFGATSPSQTIDRNPVVVTAQVRLDVGFTRERQLLTQSLDRGRRRPGNRANEQDVRGMSGALIPANPMTLILRQADSLHLTRRQADSLATLDRVYALAFGEIWSPVAAYLASLPAQYDHGAAYERYRRAREASVDTLAKLVPHVRGLLTADQLRRLPALATASLDVRYLASVRSSTAGGASLGALGLLAQLGWAGGSVDASGGNQAVMIHR